MYATELAVAREAIGIEVDPIARAVGVAFLFKRMNEGNLFGDIVTGSREGDLVGVDSEKCEIFDKEYGIFFSHSAHVWKCERETFSA
jgi:hypothetical protein